MRVQRVANLVSRLADFDFTPISSISLPISVTRSRGQAPGYLWRGEGGLLARLGLTRKASEL
jgi:hypothetical protein